MRLTKEEVVERVKRIHGDKYGGVDDIIYINNTTKIELYCPVHGKFHITPKSLFKGCGCRQCAQKSNASKQKDSVDDFIRKAKEIHEDKYDYSKVEYVNSTTDVIIICPKHGEFLMKPSKHLSGQKCPKCRVLYKTTEDFVKEYQNKFPHSEYVFQKSIYTTTRNKIIVTCPVHGDFLIRPSDLLRNHGCPQCKESKLEKEIHSFLIVNNIKFEYQKHFQWLGLQSLDFYLPDYNVAIECQGERHFVPVDFSNNKDVFRANATLDKNKERDKIKKTLCDEHSIKIIYFGDSKFLNHCPSLITRTEDLVENFLNKNR